jgi:hypothetical protein
MVSSVDGAVHNHIRASALNFGSLADFGVALLRAGGLAACTAELTDATDETERVERAERTEGVGAGSRTLAKSILIVASEEEDAEADDFFEGMMYALRVSP